MTFPNACYRDGSLWQVGHIVQSTLAPLVHYCIVALGRKKQKKEIEAWIQSKDHKEKGFWVDVKTLTVRIDPVSGITCILF